MNPNAKPEAGWDRLEGLFREAISLSPAARAEFLDLAGVQAAGLEREEDRSVQSGNGQ